MRNRMLGILGVIIVLFGALYFVVDYKNKQALDGTDNPYGTKNLHQATIDQLDDPLYQNQIVPTDLDEKLNNNEDLVVYFYSPTCSFCQETTPILMPVAEDLAVDVKKLNLLEFDDKWQSYDIEATPTLIYYENGEEVERITGKQPAEVFQAFFESTVVN